MKNKILKYSFEHKMTHIGSCLTACPIIEEIYKKKKPEDKVVISCGHAHMAHAMVAGLKPGVHCDKEYGCDVSTGSLGQGLPIALGMAIVDKEHEVYCLISDGECAEGSIWEALRIKSDNAITNLHIYVNANGFGAYDPIDIDVLEQRLRMFSPDVEFRRTQVDGLKDHYRLVTEEEYAKVTNN
jgi:transketolase